MSKRDYKTRFLLRAVAVAVLFAVSYQAFCYFGYNYLLVHGYLSPGSNGLFTCVETLLFPLAPALMDVDTIEPVLSVASFHVVLYCLLAVAVWIAEVYSRWLLVIPAAVVLYIWSIVRIWC